MLKSFLFSLAAKHVLEVKHVGSEQEHFVFSLLLKRTTKFTCHSENTLTGIEIGGDLSVKDKGSQLPKVRHLERRVVHLPFQRRKVKMSLW